MVVFRKWQCIALYVCHSFLICDLFLSLFQSLLNMAAMKKAMNTVAAFAALAMKKAMKATAMAAKAMKK